MVFCTNCGKEIADGVAFCTECGTPVDASTAGGNPAPTPQQPASPPPQQPTMAQRFGMPRQNAAATAATAPASDVVSTGAFFGLTLLFALPFVGWLICLAMAFIARNRNIRNFARSMLIWLAISLVFSVAAFFVFKCFSGSFLDYVNQVTDGAFAEWGDIFDQFKEMRGSLDQLGDLKNLEGLEGLENMDGINQLMNGGAENLPSE